MNFEGFVDRFKKNAIVIKQEKTLRKKIPCRIKINGEFVKLPSGKTLWGSKRDAKLALRNANYRLCYDMEKIARNEGGHWKASEKTWANFIAYLEHEGILEFVEV